MDIQEIVPSSSSFLAVAYLIENTFLRRKNQQVITAG
jgi:hypothetical protein